MKRRLSQSGEVLSEQDVLAGIQNRYDMLEKVREELDQKLGCQLQGYVQINRVPGNFHVSTHAYGDLVIALQMQGYSFDFSYTINHVSFGKQEDMKIIQRRFSNLGILNPLDGLKVAADFSDAEQRPYNVQTNFYLIAVPSYFRDSSNNQYNVYQLTANYQTDLRSS